MVKPHKYGNHFEKVCAQLIVDEIDNIFKEEPDLLDPDDPEPLHEMRVSINRIRNCLRYLPIFSDRNTRKTLKLECQYFARLLGTVRDFDVAKEHIEEIGEPSNPKMKIGYDWVFEVFAEDKNLKRINLKKEIELLRYDKFREHLTNFRERCQAVLELESSTNGSIAKEQQLSQRLPEVFQQLVDNYFMYQDRLAGYFSSEEVHELRKYGKRLRYTVNFFKDYRPAVYNPLRRVLKDIHDTTGDMHDIDILMPYLEAKFAELVAEEPQRSREVRSGFNWLVRKLISKRQRLMQRFIRQWGIIKSKPFKKKCEAISRPWTFRLAKTE